VNNWSPPTPYSRFGSVSMAAHWPLQSAITTHSCYNHSWTITHSSSFSPQMWICH